MSVHPSIRQCTFKQIRTKNPVVEHKLYSFLLLVSLLNPKEEWPIKWHNGIQCKLLKHIHKHGFNAPVTLFEIQNREHMFAQEGILCFRIVAAHENKKAVPKWVNSFLCIHINGCHFSINNNVKVRFGEMIWKTWLNILISSQELLIDKKKKQQHPFCSRPM